MSEAAMTYTDENTGLEFRWRGGAYIDIGTSQAMGEPGINGDDFHAYNVINVWDYAADEPTIDRSLDAFEEACREWLANNEEEA